MTMEAGTQVKVIYDFEGSESGELNVKVGDVVEITSKVDDNWLIGKLNDKSGRFPASYVTPIVQKQVVAIETFPASADGDLEFKQGDIITVLDQIDGNWWKGQLGSNIGIFPVTYVQECNASNNQSAPSVETAKAKALQDLSGQLDEELSFKKDDIISIIETIDGDWYKGVLNGKTGLVPSFCVELLSADSDLSHSNAAQDNTQEADYLRLNENLRRSLRGESALKNTNTASNSQGSEPCAKTLYPFSADNPGELSFMDGENIILTRRIDDQWFEGKIDGRVGVFPSNYVTVIVDLPPGYSSPSLPTNETGVNQQIQSNGVDKSQQGKALFDFNADTDQDLPLKAGQIVTIVEKVDADWYEAKDSYGQIGYCPVNYIEIITSKPKKRPAPKPPMKPKTADVNMSIKATTATTVTSTMPITTATATNIDAERKEVAMLSPMTTTPPVAAMQAAAQPLEPKPVSSQGDAADNMEPTAPTVAQAPSSDPVSGGRDFSPTSANKDPLLPSLYKPGGSSYKSVSFLPKGMSSSSSGDSNKGDMLQRQDAVSQQSPPAFDLSMFDSLAPPKTTSDKATTGAERTLLDASPMTETSPGGILFPSQPAASSAGASKVNPLAPQPFIAGANREIKSIQGPVASDSHSSIATTSGFGTEFDPFQSEGSVQVQPPQQPPLVASNASEGIVPLQPSQPPPPLIPTTAPVAKPTLETKLRSISQLSQDLDDFFGTSDSYTSRVSTLDSIDNAIEPTVSSNPDPQPFIPFTEVPLPPVPPRQPSPNPFAAATFEPQLEKQKPSAIVTTPSPVSSGSSRQSSQEASPGWSRNFSIDSVTSEFSDDAGYYHGLNFSIRPASNVTDEPGFKPFKIPPPPSSPRRPRHTNKEERPQSPKFDPKTAVPRPKPRKSLDSTSSLDSLPLSAPSPMLPGSGTELDSKAVISQALESFEWNVGELQRTDSVESKPPPSHPPPSLLIDVDSEVSAITQSAETASQSSGSSSAVGDLLGLGDPFDAGQPSPTNDAASKPNRPAPPVPQKVADEQSDNETSSRTIKIDVTLTFEKEGKAPPVARPPPPKKVPPRPAPPKTRPQTIIEDEILAPMRPGTMEQNEEEISSLEAKINELDADIFANKETRARLDQMLKVVSEENRESVNQQLIDCSTQIDNLTEEQNSVTSQLRQLKPDPIADMKRRNVEKREKVTKELLQTERDYVKDIKLCYEGFIGSLKDQKFQTLLARAIAAHKQQEANQEDNNKNKNSKPIARGVELDILFGNVEQVIDVSERFLENLEDSVASKPAEDQLTGMCFINYSKELEDVYSQYCRNHDDAIALLEKYEDNPDIQEYISDGLSIVRQSTNCWDLASFLIKPVQRILKYPLLLNELIKVTEDGHGDKHNLLTAINTMTDVASAINEFKRRKDLVLKYRKSDSDTISNKLGKLNLHSIKKKSQRMNQRFSQVTGFGSQTIDENFIEEERRFRDLEKTIKIFVKDVNSYLEKLQESTSSQATVAEDIADYYANQSNLDEVAKYSRSQRDLANKLYKTYTLFVQQRVVSPLNQLLIMFQGPHKLIQKRFDKLLDYDSVLQKAEKGGHEKKKSKSKDKEKDEDKDTDSPKCSKYQGIKDKEKEKQPKEIKDEREMAKRNYAAMNTQLLDELPKLYSLSVTLLKECVQSFIEAERDHFDATLKRLYPLLKLPMILDSSRENILDHFNCKHQVGVEKMMGFTFVPRSFDKKSGEKKSIKKVTSPAKSVQSHSSSQDDAHRAYLLSRYPTDALYRVTQDYTAKDSMDISIKKSDVVGILKKQDPMGGNEKWYVDNGASQGFVPPTLLEPCGDEYKTAPIASISDLSSSSRSHTGSVTEDDFGSSYLQQSQPQQQQQPEPQYYYAEWAFEGTGPNEVSLTEGGLVTVIEMHDIEGNLEWWLVEKDGQQGYVPANYLARM